MKLNPTQSSEFNGIAKDVPALALPEGLFQEDHGGDRFFRGSWRRRRGMLHDNQTQKTDPVTAIIGFELAGLDFALLFVEGTNVHGVLNATDQSY